MASAASTQQHGPRSDGAQPTALRLGAFIADTAARNDVFGAPLLAAAKRALLDCIASTLSGARAPVIDILKGTVAGRQPAQATLIGGAGVKLPLDAAALVNGTMGHATDYDDVSFTMWGHATAPVFPAVLASAEHADLSGRDFLTAFLVGLEVEMKLGAAVAPHHYGVGWHPTGSIGIFGACAGVAAALRLPADRSAMALCIAASRSAGLRANFGSMTKPLHVGFAARDGLEAAGLAAAGVTAQMAALDGAFGFIDVMAGGRSTLTAQVARLGSPFDLVSPGLAYKYYPSCSDTHIPVDTMLDIVESERIPPHDIERIDVGVTQSVHDNLIYHDPKNGLEAKFSMQFCLARALESGRLELDDFTDASVQSAATRRLMDRIAMRVEPSIGGEDYCSPALITLHRRDAEPVERLGRSARGHPDRPLDDVQLADKFKSCAAVGLPGGDGQRLYDLIQTVETLPSIRTLAAALAGERSNPWTT